MNEKLKPCPFCGGGAYQARPDTPHGGMVHCISCGAEAFGPKWNRRTPDPAVNVGAVVEAAKDFIPHAQVALLWTVRYPVEEEIDRYSLAYENLLSALSTPPQPGKPVEAENPSPQADVRPDGHCSDDAAWDQFSKDYIGRTRADLCKGDMTDFALANAQFMCDRNSLDLIVHQTAAKERIRWLSIQLARALAATEGSAE